jgi:hypothetical protein
MNMVLEKMNEDQINTTKREKRLCKAVRKHHFIQDHSY